MNNPHQHRSVQWNKHSMYFGTVFPQMLAGKRFVDVTLACEGRRIHCHRVVLAACSSYFSDLLEENPAQHPIIILPRDVKFWMIQALVEFMYQGEVSVSEDRLERLVKCADMLEIFVFNRAMSQFMKYDGRSQENESNSSSPLHRDDGLLNEFDNETSGMEFESSQAVRQSSSSMCNEIFIPEADIIEDKYSISSSASGLRQSQNFGNETQSLLKTRSSNLHHSSSESENDDSKQKAMTQLRKRVKNIPAPHELPGFTTLPLNFQELLLNQHHQADGVTNADLNTSIVSGSSSGFRKMKSLQEFLLFEQKLTNGIFLQNVKEVLIKSVDLSGRTRQHRMLALLDTLVERKVLKEFSWTGTGRRGPKHPMNKMENLQFLMRDICSTAMEPITLKDVRQFFLLKLKNATKGALTRNVRLATPHIKHKRQKGSARHSETVTPVADGSEETK